MPIPLTIPPLEYAVKPVELIGSEKVVPLITVTAPLNPFIWVMPTTPEIVTTSPLVSEAVDATVNTAAAAWLMPVIARPVGAVMLHFALIGPVTRMVLLYRRVTFTAAPSAVVAPIRNSPLSNAPAGLSTRRSD